MIAKITIGNIQRYTTNAQGVPYTYQGKTGTRVVVTGKDGKEYSAIDYSGWTKEWKIGDTVTSGYEIVKRGDREYHNISPVTRLDLLEERVERLEKNLETDQL